MSAAIEPMRSMPAAVAVPRGSPPLVVRGSSDDITSTLGPGRQEGRCSASTPGASNTMCMMTWRWALPVMGTHLPRPVVPDEMPR